VPRNAVTTRDLILDAALSVIHTIGLGRSTTKQIAARADLSEAALYRHFSDKAELFLCVIAERLPQLSMALQDLTGQVGHRSVRANLEDIARVALPFYNETLPIVTSLFAEQDLLAQHQARMRSNNIGPHRALEQLAAYLRAEQRLGRVSPRSDPEAAAALLLGACQTRALTRRFLGESDPPASDERFVKSVVRTLLEGLAVDSQD